MTGEVLELGTTMQYQLVCGSVASPVVLQAPMVTGITSTGADMRNADTITDLSGRRVERAQKGIYIVNGRKVMK